MKLPQYVDNILSFMGEKEQKYLTTSKDEAVNRMREELIEESLTAHNPVPRAEDASEPSASVQIGKDPKEVANLYKKGFSVESIAAHLTMDRDQVVSALIKSKIKPRIKGNTGRGQMYKEMSDEVKNKKNPRPSDGKSPVDFNQQDLYLGTQIEKEKTNDVREAQKIAMDHLSEDKDYYQKLQAPTEKSNPRLPSQSEVSSFEEAFLHSHLAEQADREQLQKLKKLFHDMEVFSNKYASLMLEILFKFKTTDRGQMAALSFKSGQTKEEAVQNALNRYLKLDLHMWIITMLVKAGDFTKEEISAAVNSLEGKKDLSQLVNRGNRLAHATLVFNIVGGKLLKKVDPSSFAKLVNDPENKKVVARIYNDALKVAEERYKASGRKGAAKRAENIAKEAIEPSGIEVDYTPPLPTDKEQKEKKRMLLGTEREVTAPKSMFSEKTSALLPEGTIFPDTLKNEQAILNYLKTKYNTKEEIEKALVDYRESLKLFDKKKK